MDGAAYRAVTLLSRGSAWDRKKPRSSRDRSINIRQLCIRIRSDSKPVGPAAQIFARPPGLRHVHVGSTGDGYPIRPA